MTIPSAMAQTDMRTATGTSSNGPPDRRDERWSDCWPDWSSSAEDEDPEVMAILAQRNSPRVVFTEIGRVLTALLAAFVVVGAALGAFHIH